MRRGWGIAWRRFCRIPLPEKQTYLEMDDPIQRLELLAPLT
jgi:hypothetical protein